MQKWEYLYIFTAHNGKELRVTVVNNKKLASNGYSFYEYVSQCGDEGWEMIGISSSEPGLLNVVFKRPKP